jgi:hypothetical protein
MTYSDLQMGVTCSEFTLERVWSSSLKAGLRARVTHNRISL